MVKGEFSKYLLGNILYGLWKYKDEFLSFEIAATTTIAIQYSIPGSFQNLLPHVELHNLNKLVKMATSFVLEKESLQKKYSPIKHDIFYDIFKQMANQFTINRSSYGDFARALMLFKIIPCKLINSGIELLDLPELFQNSKGYSIDDFLSISFIAYAVTGKNGIFTDDYFEVADTKLNIPPKKIRNRILSEISSTPKQYYEEMKKMNQNALSCYNFFPLLMFPIIKPWQSQPKKGYNKRYIAPIPNLIPYKAHFGIYHTFLTRYSTKFTQQFGKYIFEYYVGEILNNMISNEILNNEDEIKELIHYKKGVKIPDWLIIDNTNWIIFECKAARLPLSALTVGGVNAFESTFKKIKNAVIKISEFIDYCNQASDINFTNFSAVIVSYEPLFGFNSTNILSDIISNDYLNKNELLLFKKYLNKIIFLSIQELEIIEPHIFENNRLWDVLIEIKKSSFNDVLKALVKKTNKSYGDSFLSNIDNKFIKKIMHYNDYPIATE